VRYDAEALEISNEWRNELEAQIRSGTLPSYWEAHIAKLKKLVPALALLFHLADVGYGPIGKQSLLMALAWSDYLLSHAKRIYHFCRGENDAVETLLTHIRNGNLPNPFHLRDAQRSEWSGLKGHDVVESAIQKLIDHNILQKHIYQTAGRSGVVYFINPMVWEAGHDEMA
jgi:hypothetical protein